VWGHGQSLLAAAGHHQQQHHTLLHAHSVGTASPGPQPTDVSQAAAAGVVAAAGDEGLQLPPSAFAVAAGQLARLKSRRSSLRQG
jgi:hypothetical protein